MCFSITSELYFFQWRLTLLDVLIQLLDCDSIGENIKILCCNSTFFCHDHGTLYSILQSRTFTGIMIVKPVFQQLLNQTLNRFQYLLLYIFTEMFCQQGNILSLLRSGGTVSLRYDTVIRFFTETVFVCQIRKRNMVAQINRMSTDTDSLLPAGSLACFVTRL